MLVASKIVLKICPTPWLVLSHLYHLISLVYLKLKYESKEACQDHEALRSKPMVMSFPHSFDLSSWINKFISTKILSPRTLHTYSIHGSHLVCYFLVHSLHQLYVINGIFYDIIEAWLEESYSYNVPMNYHNDIFNIVQKVFQFLTLPTFSLF
jgi:hypothetical protein